MTAKTHILGGFFLGGLLCLTGAVSTQAAPALLTAASVGALLQDIDHQGSKVSRSGAAGAIVSFAVSAFTTHRGVIHTPTFTAAFLAALSLALRLAGISDWLTILAGLGVGMLSHLMLDTLNPSGIMWLWPWTRKRFHVASVRTGSICELGAAVALLALDAWIAASLMK